MSAGYLRDGSRNNPTMRQIAALARFFGLPPGYFFADDLAEESHENYVALPAALRRAPVRKVASHLPRLSDAALGLRDDLAGQLLNAPAGNGHRQPGFVPARAG